MIAGARRTTRTLAGVAVTVALLAGCAEPATRAASNGLPAGLPAVVPVRAGTVLQASGGTEWRFVVRSEAVDADFAAEQRALNAAGFFTTVDEVYPGSAEGQFCTARYCVDVNALDDPAFGPSLAYVVFRNTGVLPAATG